MADKIDFSTDFHLFLPDYNAGTTSCTDEKFSRQSAYNGESIDVWLVAKFDGTAAEEDNLACWKNRLSSFCVDLALKPIENDYKSPDFQSHTFFIDDMPEATDSTNQAQKTFMPCDVMNNINDHFHIPISVSSDEGPSLVRNQLRKSGTTRLKKGNISNESGMSTWPRRRKDRGSIESKDSDHDLSEGTLTLHYGSAQQTLITKNDILFQSQPTQLSDDTLVFQLTITLDCMPMDGSQVCLIAWIWTSEYDRMEHLACRPPVSDSATEVKNGERVIATAVSSVINVKSPPEVSCRQYSIGGNHFLTVRAVVRFDDRCFVVCNNLPMAVTLTGTRVLYAFTQTNSYEKTEEFISLIGEETAFPSKLLPGEVINFTFIINMANFQLWEEEIRLLGLVSWTYYEQQIIPVCSYYRLPTLVTSQAAFVFSASGYQKIGAGQTFTVSYKIYNQLHDFLSIKMNWRPEKALNDGKEIGEEERNNVMSVINNVICQEPSVQLGACRMGGSLTYSVAFQILKPGLYELGKHMRLSLHYGVNPPYLDTRRPSTTSLGAQLKNAILRPNIFNRSGSIDEGEQRSPKLRLASSHNTPTPSRSPSSQQLLPTSHSQKDLLTVTPQQILKLSYKVMAV